MCNAYAKRMTQWCNPTISKCKKKIVASRRGAVVEEAFYDKIDKLNVQAGKMDKILLAHVPRICAWHNNAILLSANTEVTF